MTGVLRVVQPCLHTLEQAGRTGYVQIQLMSGVLEHEAAFAHLFSPGLLWLYHKFSLALIDDLLPSKSPD